MTVVSTTKPGDLLAYATAQRDGDLAAPRLIALGASAGGVEALIRVVRDLPADLPAAVCIVLHISPTGSSRLTDILTRSGPLPAVEAAQNDIPKVGRIYIAPPDRHLIVSGRRLALVEGPLENSVRPAIDPLFRSAAEAYGPRLIAGVLSGMMDDGTAGLAVAKQAGAITFAQDPEDALCAPMPASAIEHVGVDHVVAASEVGGLLVDLLSSDAKVRPPTPRTRDRSVASDQVCPDCSGVLRQMDEAGVVRFRCRVGHIYSPEALLGAQDHRLEAALWTAIRSLEDAASLSGRLARAARDRNSPASAARFERRQRDSAERADLVRSAILTITGLDETPSEARVADAHDSDPQAESEAS